MSKKRQMLWIKMMLGDLNIADIRPFIGDEVSFGSHWLPIYAKRKQGEMLGISVHTREVWPDPDICVPLRTSVKIQGDIARFELETFRILGSCHILQPQIEVRIKMLEDVFPENASPDS